MLKKKHFFTQNVSVGFMCQGVVIVYVMNLWTQYSNK